MTTARSDIGQRRYVNKDGLTVTMGSEINSGGEGRILEIQNHPQLLAKIYTASTPAQQGMLVNREAKIRSMLAMKPLASSGRFAWPLDALYRQETGKTVFCGFIMKRTPGTTLVTLTSPSLTLKRIPCANNGRALRRFIHNALIHLATGMEELEQRGVLVGDVSMTNFLINQDDGAVGFIDCDGYQVQSLPDAHGNRVLFPAGASTPEFLPPELLATQGEIQRTSTHLRFSAAILFFQLLTHGWHPYQCLGAESPVENILKGRTAMGAWHGLATGYYPRGVYEIYLKAIHPAIKQAFINTLVRGHKHPEFRTDFGNWRRAITNGANAL